jgi:hypothetical protein
MPDITMCKGLDANNRICKLAEHCERYKARPSYPRQSWFALAPFKQVSTTLTECEMFMMEAKKK